MICHFIENVTYYIFVYFRNRYPEASNLLQFREKNHNCSEHPNHIFNTIGFISTKFGTRMASAQVIPRTSNVA